MNVRMACGVGSVYTQRPFPWALSSNRFTTRASPAAVLATHVTPRVVSKRSASAMSRWYRLSIELPPFVRRSAPVASRAPYRVAWDRYPPPLASRTMTVRPSLTATANMNAAGNGSSPSADLH